MFFKRKQKTPSITLTKTVKINEDNNACYGFFFKSDTSVKIEIIEAGKFHPLITYRPVDQLEITTFTIGLPKVKLEVDNG